MSRLTPEQQTGGLGALDFAADLFGESPREEFTREEVVRVLRDLKRAEGLFDAGVRERYELAAEAIARSASGAVS